MKLSSLPKYKKVWSKERVNFGHSEKPKQIFLVFDEYNPILHHGEWISRRLLQWEPELYPCEDIYFFEIFKYLRKFQDYMAVYGSQHHKQDLKDQIKKHLIKKHSRQLTMDKLSTLNSYSRLVNHVFDNIDIRNKISLVIQKKIGYKYYENITYT